MVVRERRRWALACLMAFTPLGCNALFAVDDLRFEESATGGSAGDGGIGGAGGATSTSSGTGGSTDGSDTGVGGSGGGGGGLPADIADLIASVDGLRLESPCGPLGPQSYTCQAGAVSETVIVGGDPSRSYRVRLRFRGVVEMKAYVGGITDGYVNIGGTPATDSWNVISLSVSSPAETYHLNGDVSGGEICFAIDYEATIDVDGGAQLTRAADPVNTLQVKNIDVNGNPIVIQGVPPAPDAYNGQFLQLNVVDVQVL
ncbi:MAG: hypothetical protein JRI68_19760 [Deltaproteobacteria bacterium]|nr:hypothetical protein [Deltaproteobacteria bacterium]